MLYQTGAGCARVWKDPSRILLTLQNVQDTKKAGDRIQAIVPPELRRWYDERAAINGLSLSSYLERVLNAYRLIIMEETE